MDRAEFIDHKADMLLLGLMGKHYRYADVAPRIKSIRERVGEQLENSSSSDREFEAEAWDTMVSLVVAGGLGLPAYLVANTLNVGGHLSDDKAICLWLGFLYDHSPFPEGIWQMYEDCVEEGVLNANQRLPDKINGKFHKPTGNSGELGTYCDEKMKSFNVQEGKTLELIARILGTDLVNVHNNLRRGYNTLLCGLLQDMYQTVDEVR